MKQIWQLTLSGVFGALVAALVTSIAYQATIVGDTRENAANIAALHESLMEEVQNRKDGDIVQSSSMVGIISLQRSIIDQNIQLISLIKVQNQILNGK